MKKFNVNPNSELQIRIKKKEWINHQGQTVIESEWVVANGDVSLGSNTEPNEKVLEFRYNIPDNKPLFKKLFGD